MGRVKLQMKRIEDKSSRHVTFSKRRAGLMKKARELSVLCEVELALFVFSSKEKLYQFCSGDSLRKILEHYQMQKNADVPSSSHDSEKPSEGQMDIEFGTVIQRHFEEQKVEQLDVTELTQLEHRLDAKLNQMRIRKSQLMTKAVTDLQEKENQLRGKSQATEEEMSASMMINGGENCQYQQELQQQEDPAATAASALDLHLQPFYFIWP